MILQDYVHVSSYIGTSVPLHVVFFQVDRFSLKTMRDFNTNVRERKRPWCFQHPRKQWGLGNLTIRFETVGMSPAHKKTPKKPTVWSFWSPVCSQMFRWDSFRSPDFCPRHSENKAIGRYFRDLNSLVSAQFLFLSCRFLPPCTKGSAPWKINMEPNNHRNFPTFEVHPWWFTFTVVSPESSNTSRWCVSCLDL